MSISDIFSVRKSHQIIKWSMDIARIVMIIFLVVVSIFAKDIKYPKEHPYLFTLETLLMSFGVASLIFFMAYGRGVLNIETLFEYLIKVLKYGLLHILLQFSGFYSYLLHYEETLV